MQRVSQGDFKSCIHDDARCMRPPNITCLRQLQPCGTRFGEQTVHCDDGCLMFVFVAVQAEVCTVVDCGSSSCEFIRSTVNQARLVACLALCCRLLVDLASRPGAGLSVNCEHGAYPHGSSDPISRSQALFLLANLATRKN